MKNPLVLGSLFLCFSSSLFGQSTWLVDQSGGGDFLGIQEAINDPQVVSGDEVLVFPGTYFENVDFLGKEILVVSQQGPSVTTIDGGGWFGGGTVVSFVNGEGPGARLNGFRISRGDGDLHWPSQGGGIHCEGSGPVISNCSIDSNEAPNGGGVLLLQSNLVFNDCSFISNYASENGGGVLAVESSVLFNNCEAILNSVWQSSPAGGGAGIYLLRSTSEMIDCYMGYNDCYGDGGAIYAQNSTLTIQDSEFYRNQCGERGGALFGNQSNFFINDAIFERNDGYNGGGGALYALETNFSIRDVFFHWNEGAAGGAIFFTSPGVACNGSLVNCLFLGNETTYSGLGWGGAITESSDGQMQVLHCTFAYNDSAHRAGSIASDPVGPTTVVKSCISYLNSAANGGTDLVGVFDVSFSCIPGSWPGTGNISLDPRWVNAGNGDLHLKQTPTHTLQSPCVDAGDPAFALNLGTTRSDEVWDSGIPDMGYHYPMDSPEVSISNLVAGQTATLQVDNCYMGGTVIAAYSLAGGGPVNTPWGEGLLTPPYTRLPLMVADAFGVASYSFAVPPGAVGLNVWFQSLDWGTQTLSNGLPVTVQ